MEKQCAGCGTVFEDGNEPKGVVTPRPYGCCPDCNKASFRSKEHEIPKGTAHSGDPELLAFIGEGRGIRDDGSPYPTEGRETASEFVKRTAPAEAAKEPGVTTLEVGGHTLKVQIDAPLGYLVEDKETA